MQESKKANIKALLDEKYEKYNNPAFITSDPIQIPHQFTKKEDIEISAFLAATIAWGQRCTIIKNAHRLMQLMDNNPHEFIVNSSKTDLKRFKHFVHRTFNGDDCMYFVKSLKNIYTNHGGLEALTAEGYKKNHNIDEALGYLRKIFFEIEGNQRTNKHFSDVSKGSSAKRLNMFLRWMVRKDKRGVDFGLWNKISMEDLYLPLDVHTGNIARKLGLLKRSQNDWKAVVEVTEMLRQFDKHDPVKYDFALFGLGIFEKF